MKKLINCCALLILSVFLLTFCSKDENDIIDPIKVLDADDFTSLIEAEGATVITGLPPAPTGGDAPVLNALSQKFTGWVEYGVENKFATEGSYKGVYILVEGASSYLKIPLDDGLRLAGNPRDRISNALRMEGENALNIFLGLSGLNEEGDFCYEISLYDEDNNVSNVETVCVEINGWGGNNALVGKWRYREEEVYQEDILVDEEVLNWNQILYDSCTISDTVVLAYQHKKQSYLEFKANGDYFDVYNDIALSAIPECAYDFTGNLECPFYLGTLNRTFVGKWSYNATTKEVILLDFENYCNYGTPAVEGEVYEEAGLYILGDVNLRNSITLEITSVFSEGDYEKLVFRKFL